MIDPFRLYSPPEVVRETHAPRALVYEALEDGSLTGIRRGRRWWVAGSAVQEWVERLAEV